jgi:murein DD-endopeptidase MepM/ murein hydrolase activator NlpD
VSNRVKGLCGGVLIFLGYSPVLLDLFFKANNKAEFHVSEVAGEIIFQTQEQAGNNVLFCEDFSKQKDSLIQDLIKNEKASLAFNFSRESFSTGKVPDVSSASVSPIIIVSKGNFAGSRFVKGDIKSNFYEDARKLGIPAGVVDSVIHNLSSKVDFKRSLKKGDSFEILYSQKNVMLYAKITTKRSKSAVYRVANDSSSAYYFENGVKTAQVSNSRCFGQPLKGRLNVTSPFGYRKHPVYNKYHHHSGVDLGASYGAPVYAVYDGVVTKASLYYGYGKCVEVAHASGYRSRYGHLSKYAVYLGTKVRKGQIIGYVGRTGTTTGNHLHLELARNNVTINPLSVKMMPDEITATVPNAKKFKELKYQIERISTAS